MAVVTGATERVSAPPSLPGDFDAVELRRTPNAVRAWGVIDRKDGESVRTPVKIGEVALALAMYSSEVERLKEEVESLSAETRMLREEITKLQALKVENDQLRADNEAKDGRIAELEAQVEALTDPTPAVAADIPSDSKFKRGWNRTTGWLGERLRFGRQAEAEPLYRRQDGVYVEQVEETYDGRLRSDIRRGSQAVGAAAIILVGGLVAYGWGEHEESEGTHHKTTPIITNQNGDELKTIQQEVEQLGVNLPSRSDVLALIDRLKKDVKADRYSNHLAETNNRLELQTRNAVRHNNQLLKHAQEQTSSRMAGSEQSASTTGEAIYVAPGDGYTNLIEDAFPDHTASEYLDAHKAALTRFGPNYVQGVGHYTMAGGGLGLSRPGRAVWASEVKGFLQSYFGSSH
jgi:FtsZ-binding cell division protein ZapB